MSRVGSLFMRSFTDDIELFTIRREKDDLIIKQDKKPETDHSGFCKPSAVEIIGLSLKCVK
ncbi:protein of unknown function [Methylotuvimicrobium alcaliphilum 20Z]|uniref:Uncharacterized protein n=1 Tax=Methylotuvimicrobium alcaliphilum (strain DSM 19304 / NCIMB 14124 / VKM B-2133 / 20Z) TaxID=1091494 RepID=G4SW13_META2|nr:protein of unknown function [Methylotuvimicrobium alcaliphilum 20Z]